MYMTMLLKRHRHKSPHHPLVIKFIYSLISTTSGTSKVKLNTALSNSITHSRRTWLITCHEDSVLLSLACMIFMLQAPRHREIMMTQILSVCIGINEVSRLAIVCPFLFWIMILNHETSLSMSAWHAQFVYCLLPSARATGGLIFWFLDFARCMAHHVILYL